MKKLFLIALISMLTVCQFVHAQTDSTKAAGKSYKRNIQGLLLAGVISLYYEQAFTKHSSIKFRGTFAPPGHIPFRKSVEIPLSVVFSTQYRYYFNKNKRYNEGFYLNGTFAISYIHSFEDCYYDNSIDKIYIVDNDYRPYSASEQYDVYYEKIQAYLGFGFGYQWICGKRFVMDLGITPCVQILNIERFKHTENNEQWRNTIYGEDASWWKKKGGPIDLNFSIGYAF